MFTPFPSRSSCELFIPFTVCRQPPPLFDFFASRWKERNKRIIMKTHKGEKKGEFRFFSNARMWWNLMAFLLPSEWLYLRAAGEAGKNKTSRDFHQFFAFPPVRFVDKKLKNSKFHANLIMKFSTVKLSWSHDDGFYLAPATILRASKFKLAKIARDVALFGSRWKWPGINFRITIIN